MVSPCKKIVLCIFLAVSLLSCKSQAQNTVTLVSHRAIYKLSLDSIRSGSSIADVQGRMTYEFQDVCDAWVLKQDFELNFLQIEGGETSSLTVYNAWEKKDASEYRFNIRKTVNNELRETLAGRAVMNTDKNDGIAYFLRPKKTEIRLEKGTLLPTEHTIRLLQMAEKEEPLFSRKVFDGSEIEGPVEISAWILAAEKQQDKNDTVMAKNVLTAGKTYWPLRMAVYGPKQQETLPEYQSLSILYDNGIWGDTTFDYNEFKVRAELEKLEEIPAISCPPPR